jgi:hypothetical protein
MFVVAVVVGGVTVVIIVDICLFDVDNVVLTFAFVVIGVDEGNILYLLRLIEDTLALFDEDVLSLMEILSLSSRNCNPCDSNDELLLLLLTITGVLFEVVVTCLTFFILNIPFCMGNAFRLIELFNCF